MPACFSSPVSPVEPGPTRPAVLDCSRPVQVAELASLNCFVIRTWLKFASQRVEPAGRSGKWRKCGCCGAAVGRRWWVRSEEGDAGRESSLARGALREEKQEEACAERLERRPRGNVRFRTALEAADFDLGAVSGCLRSPVRAGADRSGRGQSASKLEPEQGGLSRARGVRSRANCLQHSGNFQFLECTLLAGMN